MNSNVRIGKAYQDGAMVTRMVRTLPSARGGHKVKSSRISPVCEVAGDVDFSAAGCGFSSTGNDDYGWRSW